MRVKQTFVADDGTEFDSSAECTKYELDKRQNHRNLPLKKQYEIVKGKFEEYSNRKGLSDDYLIG